MDTDSWSIVKKFLIVKCECCDKMINDNCFKCHYCKHFLCFDVDLYHINEDEDTWEELHMCHDCQQEYAMSVFKNREPNYTGDGGWKKDPIFKNIE